MSPTTTLGTTPPGSTPAEGQATDPAAYGESAHAFVFCYHRVTRSAPLAQIPWGDDFEHETARELFGSNLLALTWIKGEAMPDELVDEILRGLGRERETDEQRRRRVSKRSSGSVQGMQEMMFRTSVGTTPPWGLGALELTKWLDREWLGSDVDDEDSEDEDKKRNLNVISVIKVLV